MSAGSADDLFICESCGGVTWFDCPRCPDRGNGRGVTVGRIKDDLRNAPDMASLNATSKHYGRHTATLHKAGGDAAVMAIQIRNLVAYRRVHFWMEERGH